jgi:hypothetical protein
MAKIDQMDMNVFRCKTLQNLRKLGILVSKYAIWQPCLEHEFTLKTFFGSKSFGVGAIRYFLISRLAASFGGSSVRPGVDVMITIFGDF